MAFLVERQIRQWAAAIACVVGLGLACDGGSDLEPLGAPTDLVAKPLDGGVHLTWTDNSSAEAHFMVYRMKSTDKEYGEAIAEPMTNSYHDASLATGTYMYKVHAMDAAGKESPDSNEATVTVP